MAQFIFVALFHKALLLRGGRYVAAVLCKFDVLIVLNPK